LVVLFFIALTAATSTVDDCGCTASSTTRENLFECVVPLNVNTNFIPDGYDSVTKELITDQAKFFARTEKALFVREVFYRTFYVARMYSARNNFAHFFAARQSESAHTMWNRLSVARLSIAKRQATTAEADICTCLSNTVSCLNTSSCGSTPLPELCGLAAGRFFGGCQECAGFSMGSQYQTAINIMEKIGSLNAALVEFIETQETAITGLDFTYDFTTGSVAFTATVGSGLDSTIPLNNVVYYLSAALDVFPGTISYVQDSTAKRQSTTVTGHLVVVDEETVASVYDNFSSASSNMVSVLALAAVVLRFF